MQEKGWDDGRFVVIGADDSGVTRQGSQGKRREELPGPPTATVHDMAHCGLPVRRFDRGRGSSNPLAQAEAWARDANGRDFDDAA